jgi:hypothetical protein
LSSEGDSRLPSDELDVLVSIAYLRLKRSDRKEPVPTMTTQDAPNIREHKMIPGTLSLVLPAYNEAENIEIVVRRAMEYLPHYADDFRDYPGQ